MCSITFVFRYRTVTKMKLKGRTEGGGLVCYRGKLTQRPYLQTTVQESNIWQFLLFNIFFWERSASVSALWAVTEAWPCVLFLTLQEIFFHSCVKYFVLKIWLQLRVMLCHPWRIPPGKSAHVKWGLLAQCVNLPHFRLIVYWLNFFTSLIFYSPF